MESSSEQEAKEAPSERVEEAPFKTVEEGLLRGYKPEHIAETLKVPLSKVFGVKGALIKKGLLQPASKEEGEGEPRPEQPQEKPKQAEAPLEPAEVQLEKAILERLRQRLPKVYGIGKAAASIIESLEENPSITLNPMSLFNHVKQLCPRVNDYSLSLCISGVFNSLADEGWPVGRVMLPMQPMTYPWFSQPFAPTLQYPLKSYHDNPTINILMSRIERLEDQLQRERESRLEEKIKNLEQKMANQPSFLDQLDSFLRISQRLGLRGQKTTIDLISEVSDKIDKRIQSLEKTLSKPPAIRSFKPEIVYSPLQRKLKVEEIERKLEKTKEILKCEDELIEHERRRRR